MYTLKEAQALVEKWRREYNEVTPHSSERQHRW
ncbi:MAG: transposase [Bacteriovoracaceae bacterium]|nr:transposase [Bacteriovoracaceae bacterium]